MHAAAHACSSYAFAMATVPAHNTHEWFDDVLISLFGSALHGCRLLRRGSLVLELHAELIFACAWLQEASFTCCVDFLQQLVADRLWPGGQQGMHRLLASARRHAIGAVAAMPDTEAAKWAHLRVEAGVTKLQRAQGANGEWLADAVTDVTMCGMVRARP